MRRAGDGFGLKNAFHQLKANFFIPVFTCIVPSFSNYKSYAFHNSYDLTPLKKQVFHFLKHSLDYFFSFLTGPCLEKDIFSVHKAFR